MTPPVHVDVWGRGEPVLLVHGSGPPIWRDQRSLAERWQLRMVHRRGFGQSPAADRSDFDVDAADVAELLGGRMHLLGSSYGAVVSLVAAGLRPDAVRSLIVCEPPAFGLARGDPAVDALIGRLQAVYDSAPAVTPDEFDAAFDRALGFDHPAAELSPQFRAAVRMVMVERPPWEAKFALDALAQAAFPKLVISGAWRREFDLVCDILERRLGAERAVLPGSGHSLAHAPGFNERVEAFWRAAP